MVMTIMHALSLQAPEEKVQCPRRGEQVQNSLSAQSYLPTPVFGRLDRLTIPRSPGEVESRSFSDTVEDPGIVTQDLLHRGLR
jgi:hypothetical protein